MVGSTSGPAAWSSGQADRGSFGGSIGSEAG